MSFTITKSISTDFSSGVAAGKFHREIVALPLASATLEQIKIASAAPDDCLIITDVEPSAADKTAIDGAVTAHLGLEDPPTIRDIRTAKQGSRDTKIVKDHVITDFPDNGLTESIFTFEVPEEWDSAKDPKIGMRAFTTDTDTSKSYRLAFGMRYTKEGETVAMGDNEPLAFTQAAPDAADEMFHSDLQTMDRTKIEKMDTVRVVVRRRGSHGDDDRQKDMNMVKVFIDWPV